MFFTTFADTFWLFTLLFSLPVWIMSLANATPNIPTFKRVKVSYTIQNNSKRKKNVTVILKQVQPGVTAMCKHNIFLCKKKTWWLVFINTGHNLDVTKVKSYIYLKTLSLLKIKGLFCSKIMLIIYICLFSFVEIKFKDWIIIVTNSIN